ncbi:class I SAM-dependent methyltransferase [Shewanella aquimarina]|uniref:class I SAM-dependent methyltransferase n=1 Tax=Shewanella aquimarina TaxID=260365 RepID=UPI002014E818|nr:class I SAM-dependent methyltransferase [Shewanella aquimarina]MCL2908535.1 class I SAM-dependent methyltransferase [Shewanella aquimarina]
MSQHWDEYWQQGHLTSFGDSFSGNYSGVLETNWHHDFNDLPDNFKVLDLATGNGALPLLLNQFFKDSSRKGEVIGVDLAKISTKLDELVLNKQVDVSLVSNIDCSDLPFDDNSFDLVISQYGLEYSDLALSIPEALRVLRPGGRLSLVTHHSRSMIINRNRRILTLISQQVIARVFQTIDTLILQMGTLTNAEDVQRIKQNQECERLRHQLNQEISTLAQSDEGALKDSELLTYVATLFQQGLFWPLAKKQEYLAFARQQIDTLKDRLGELVEASLDELALSAMLANLIELGANLVSINQIEDHDGQVLGWKIVINKTN